MLEVYGERRRHRWVVAAAAFAAVVALGVAVRTPARPSELTIDTRPRPAPAPVGSTVLRALDPTYLTDVPGAVLAFAGEAWTAASDDGHLLAVGGTGGTVVVDRGSLTTVATLPPGREPRFTPEGDGLVVAGPSGGVALHPFGGVPFPPVPLPGELAPADLTPLAGGRVAAFTFSGRTGRASVVDLRTGAVLVHVRLPALRSDHPALAWDVERERLYLADAYHLRVIDLATGRMVAERDLPTMPSRALVAPDGAGLYLTGPEGAQHYDTASLAVLAQHDRAVAGAALSPDGRWLALDGWPRGVRVLDAATLLPVADLGGPRRSVVGFSAGSERLYTTGPGPGPDGSTLLAIDLATLRVVGTRTLLGPGSWSPRAAVLSEVSSGAPR